MKDALPFTPSTMLAPMEGVTDPLFREVMAERPGLGVVCTEFVRISRAPIRAVHLRAEVVKIPGVPLSVQIMGNDADCMADAAGIVSEAGADIVDINLGCPTRKASKNGVGAAMLKDPDLLYKVLSSMRARVPGCLSAKIRAGWDDATHILAIAQAIEAAGANFIVVHPRLRTDAFKGVADWRIVAALKSQISIPVIGNGDCWYAAPALHLQKAMQCDGIMIGRPALRNPWIFQQMAQIRSAETPVHPDGAMVAAFLHDLMGRFCAALHVPTAPIGRMKEIIGWVGRAIDDDRLFLRQALRAKSIQEIQVIIDTMIAPLPAHAIDMHSEGLLQLEKCPENSDKNTEFSAVSRHPCAVSSHVHKSHVTRTDF